MTSIATPSQLCVSFTLEPSAQTEHPWTTAVAPWEKRPVAPAANWSASSRTNWYKEILVTSCQRQLVGTMTAYDMIFAFSMHERLARLCTTLICCVHIWFLWSAYQMKRNPVIFPDDRDGLSSLIQLWSYLIKVESRDWSPCCWEHGERGGLMYSGVLLSSDCSVPMLMKISILPVQRF